MVWSNMFMFAGGPLECLERVGFARRPSVFLTRAITHKNVHSLPKRNPSAWIGPRWQEHTGNNCFETKETGEQCRLGFAGDRDAPDREPASCKLGRRCRGGAGQGESLFPRRRPLRVRCGRQRRVCHLQSTQIAGVGVPTCAPQRQDARSTVEVQP